MAVERFPIEAGHIMLFARAIGEDDPAYYGAISGADSVPAPPTFVQASAQFDPDYFLRPKIGQKWFGSGRTDSGLAGGGGGEGSAGEDVGKAVGSSASTRNRTSTGTRKRIGCTGSGVATSSTRSLGTRAS